MGTGASQQNATSKGVPKRTNAASSAASTDIASASLDAKLAEASARLKGRAKEASLEAAGAGTIDTKVQTRAAVSQGATQPHTSPWRSNNAARFADREYERRHHKRERAPELEAPAPVLLASPRKEQLDVVNELHAILIGVSRERQANREKQSAQTTPPQVAVASIPQLSSPSSSSSSLVSFQKRLVAVANAANQHNLSSRDAARCACTASLLAALLTRDDKSANKLLHDGKFPPRGDDSPSTLPSEVVLLLVDVDYAYYHAHVASLVNSVSMLDAVRKALCSALEACQVMPPFATERGALLALNAAMSHAELVGLDDDNMIEIARDELVYRGFQQGERPPIDGEEAARNDARRTSALLAEIARFQTQVDVAGRANRAIVARAEAQIASRHEMEEQLALVFTRVEEARVEEARRRAEMHLSNIEQQAASAAEAGRQAVLRVQHGVQSHARLVARRAEPRCMVGIADLAGLAARVRRLGLED